MKNLRSNFRGRFRGFTLIELLISLAIIGVAIIAIVGMSQNASNSSKVQAEVKNLQAITTAVESSFGASGSYVGLTTAIAQKSGAFPTQMIVAGIPRNTWNGTVTVAVDTLASPALGYDITYTNVPQPACIALAGQVAQTFTNMKIGGVSNRASVWTPVLIAGACADVDSNVLIFNGG